MAYEYISCRAIKRILKREGYEDVRSEGIIPLCTLRDFAVQRFYF